MPDQTRHIYLLRHGAIDAAKGGVYGGASDIPLSPLGWQQMQAVQACLSVDSIASSPMQRCLSAAQQWAADLAIDCRIDEGFREMDFGDWEGQMSAEIAKLPQAKAFFHDPCSLQAPNGESFDDVLHRVRRSWTAYCASLSGGKHVLITHAVVIRIILADALALPLRSLWRLSIEHASYSSLSLYPDEDPCVLHINRVA